METLQIIGVARNHDELVDLIRDAKNMRQITDAVCDEIAGMATGHTAKILGPSRIRNLGRLSLDLLLDTLGLRLVVEADPERHARVADRYEQRKSRHVRSPAKVARASLKRARPVILAELAKLGNEARNRVLSGEQRTAIARKAALARHRKRRAKSAGKDAA